MFGGFGFVPVSDRSELDVHRRDAARLRASRTRAQKSEEAAALARAHPEVAYTYTTIGSAAPAARAGRGPGARLRAAEAEEGPRRLARRRSAKVHARASSRSVGGAKVSVFSSGFGGAFKQIQLQLRGPDSRKLNAARRADRATIVRADPGAVDVGLSTRGAEARAAGEDRPRPRRHARRDASRRSRSRSGPRSPASTRATGWTRTARPATSTCGSLPRRGERATDLARLPLVISRPAHRARRR